MIFLPPNSTHLAQPLDLSFFRPLKIAWREILLKWKKGEWRKESSIPKSKKNILSGFKKGGNVPLNRQEVLRCLPEEPIEVEDVEIEAANNSILDLLKELRYTPGKRIQFDSESDSASSNIYNAETANNIEYDEHESDQSMDFEEPEDTSPSLSPSPSPSCNKYSDMLSQTDINVGDWVLVKFPVDKKMQILSKGFI
ncbi:uncharacterized protein LOC115886146 [Sitophilus oryzae]|uniref:Uncharacterized protein LOC115886146 n=1 Tax=Sitophilus oryzae TaxID=7048 RepID=A0A6J2YDW6_SITOR|nr:uncharacterized protein LOC115886146 [Sitophilus oryzae]